MVDEEDIKAILIREKNKEIRAKRAKRAAEEKAEVLCSLAGGNG